MNYNELQQIVRYIRKNLPCSHCEKAYHNEEIEVLSTFDDQGLFNLSCHKCHNQILVHITISDQETHLSTPGKARQQIIRAHRSITEKDTANALAGNNGINSNDVIDIHTFLNNFNGDFKKLFSPKK